MNSYNKHPNFYSLWHSCLYGIGNLSSLDVPEKPLVRICENVRAVCRMPRFKGDRALTSGYALDLMISGELLELNVLIHSLSDHLLSLKNGAGETEVRQKIRQILLIAKGSQFNKKEMADRDSYEFILAISRLIHDAERFQVYVYLDDNEMCELIKNVYRLVCRIQDPFLYVRCASVWYMALSYTYLGGRAERLCSDQLLALCARMLRDMPLLNAAGFDGVHDGNDRVAFSSSLLLRSVSVFYSPADQAEWHAISQVSALNQHYFIERLTPESKASQLGFYLLARDSGLPRKLIQPIKLGHRAYIESRQAAVVYRKVLDDYLQQAKPDSAVDYLRCAYLLVQAAQLSKLSDVPVAITSTLLDRLRRTFIASNDSEASTNKYADDVLVFCYSMVVWSMGAGKSLERELVEASERLRKDFKVNEAQRRKLMNTLRCCVSQGVGKSGLDNIAKQRSFNEAALEN